MATARDVARRAGVSTSTVSHVLNGTRGVSKELSERVLAACEELSFEPNVVARSLKTNRSLTIGFVVPDVNAFFTEILLGAEEVAEERGYSVIFCHSRDDPQRERSYLRLLRGRRVDGIILAPYGTGNDDLKHLVESRFPLVLVDRTIPGYSIDVVSVDNEPSAYAAVRHLIDLGHRRIAMVSGDPRMSSTAPRVRGYMQAHLDAGIPIEPSLHVSGSGRTKEGHQAVLKLMSGPARPSAMFVANNLMTIGAMIAFQELGIAIPGDLAYVGFDDFEWAGLLRPQLTTIAQPTYEIGRTAAQLVIDQIGNDPAKPARRVSLSGRLVVRGSSGAADSQRDGYVASPGHAKRAAVRPRSAVKSPVAGTHRVRGSRTRGV